MGRLGDVQGRAVLDWGCGHGMAATVLARRGATVTACDLSAGYVAEARARAQANGVAISCLVANAERLPVVAGTFDAVWGHAILHHLDVPTAARELRRVLRPGGVAVLCEPWGGNPLLRAARHYLPYPGKGRTPDETPLDAGHIEQIRKVFPRVDVEGFQLLGMLRRVFRRPAIDRTLRRGDERILGRWPGLQNYCRYVVLTLHHDGD